MPLDLCRILEIENLTEYKLHAARWNDVEQPLDVFTRDRNEWLGWNSWRGKKNDFNRRYIIALIHFYVERSTWLFGGMFEVMGRGAPGNNSYTITSCERGADLVGRLKIQVEISRGRAFKFENIADRMVISELLREAYTGEPFAGFDNVSVDFSMLEVIVKNDRLDWKTALQNTKGVYLIVDRKTGKKYVGSAYNDVGIWSRWCTYVATGHGWNQALVELLVDGGVTYARENFRMTLLEAWPFRTDDKIIISRESYWKEALLTRGDHGYNRN